jgi:hypothetical protein
MGMATASQTKQIDKLMERASQALVKTKYFDAEALAVKALHAARQAEDFERMGRIVLPLQEARRQRLQIALEADHVTVVSESVTEETRAESGCYLVQPPQVGADARRLRLGALERKIPVAVVCREPLTQLKRCPVVAIGPGVTVRTHIDPPDDPDDVGMAWFVYAMEEIGDAAIGGIDPGLATLKRLEALLGRLEAIPDHEGLHLALEETCREAAQEHAAAN